MSILLPENAIEVVRGQSKTLKLTVKDKAGVVVDLTGSTIYFTVKEKLTDPKPLIQKLSTNIAEIEVPNPVDGTANIFIVPDDTRSLGRGKYVYDLWIVLSTGERNPLIKPSTFEVTLGATVIAP